jgi:putative two-component system response regulator
VTTPLPLRELDRSAAAVLVADGEDAVRVALQRYLADLKFEVLTAASGREALDLIGQHRVGCALLNLQLPDGSAAELVPRLLDREPSLAILLLTSPEDAAAAAVGVTRGALDYLVKPVDLVALSQAVQHALRRRDALIESERINAWLKEEVTRRTEELHRERENLQRLSVEMLEALVNALEAKDPHLRGHSGRVADLAARVAVEYGLDASQVEMVRTAGRLHDIGKIGIREQVLNKQGPLTSEEYEHIKQHPVMGAQILAPLTHLRDALAFVRSHHERWDGTGYPDGRAGEAIPIGGRIIGAAEIFDALTTSRPYQDTMSPEQAVGRMRDLVGTVLDPRVHEALARVIGAGVPAAS